MAREQTRGHGRQGRIWHSPPGGLWWSLLLKPPLSPEKAKSLSAATSLGILQGISKATQAPMRLKWPNDILLEGKKLSGVIVETSIRGQLLEWAVLGAGINVNNTIPHELEKTATSLSRWAGHEIDLSMLLNTVLDEVFSIYDLFLKGGFPGIKSLYMDKLLGLGEPVSLLYEGETYRGNAVDIDLEGRLLIEFSDNKKRPFSAAEAHLLTAPL